MGVTGLDMFLRLGAACRGFRWPLQKPEKTINAEYNPVTEAESILAQDALNVSALAGTGSLVSALAY